MRIKRCKKRRSGKNHSKNRVTSNTVLSDVIKIYKYVSEMMISLDIVICLYTIYRCTCVETWSRPFHQFAFANHIIMIIIMRMPNDHSIHLQMESQSRGREKCIFHTICRDIFVCNYTFCHTQYGINTWLFCAFNSFNWNVCSECFEFQVHCSHIHTYTVIIIKLHCFTNKSDNARNVLKKEEMEKKMGIRSK